MTHVGLSIPYILFKSRGALVLLIIMLLLFSLAKQDFRMQKVQTFQEDKSLPKQTRKPQRVEHSVMRQPTRTSRLK